MRYLMMMLSLLSALSCSSTPKAEAPVPAISQQAVVKHGYEERMARVYKTVNFLKGVPYVWGGTSPNWGMDCSGFSQFVMREVGVKLPRTVKEQAKVGQRLKPSHVKPGDLIFFNASPLRSGIDHVGIYLGRGYFAHSKSPIGVTLEKLKNYEHDVEFGGRVFHSKLDIWEEYTPVVYKPQPKPVVKPIRRVKPKKRFVDRKTGKGRVVKLERKGKQVEYTVHLNGNEYYEFVVDWEDYKSFAGDHGSLLGRMINWDEEYYGLEE